MTKPTIATISQDMKYLKEGLDKIEHKLENGFMPKSELELRLAEVNREIANLQVRIIEVETIAKQKDWKSHTLTSVLTAVGVLAITYIFNDITK